MSLRDRVTLLYRQYETYVPAAFFFAGFLFDVLTLGRIDDALTIGSQAVYLIVIALYLALEMIDSARPLSPPRAILWLWKYRAEIVHFLFGSLLSAYTLFYFKSASLVASGFFLLFMIAIMVANEFSRFQQSGVLMRFGLLSLCLSSYLAYVIPVFAGYIGFLPFLGAILVSSLLILSLARATAKYMPATGTGDKLVEIEAAAETPASAGTRLRQAHEQWRARPLVQRARHVAIAVQLVFVMLYFLQLIPPVPLSAQYMGIYHKVDRAEGQYILSYDRPWWKFWQSGAQTFLARPGDRVYVFARIFSPTNFKDQIRVRWLYHDDRQGWQSSDAIPISITGGRDEGFRGFAFKQNYAPGDWRVQLETTDGREISRIGFTIVKDDDTDDREFKTDTE